MTIGAGKTSYDRKTSERLVVWQIFHFSVEAARAGRLGVAGVDEVFAVSYPS